MSEVRWCNCNGTAQVGRGRVWALDGRRRSFLLAGLVLVLCTVTATDASANPFLQLFRRRPPIRSVTPPRVTPYIPNIPAGGFRAPHARGTGSHVPGAARDAQETALVHAGHVAFHDFGAGDPTAFSPAALDPGARAPRAVPDCASGTIQARPERVDDESGWFGWVGLVAGAAGVVWCLRRARAAGAGDTPDAAELQLFWRAGAGGAALAGFAAFWIDCYPQYGFWHFTLWCLLLAASVGAFLAVRALWAKPVPVRFVEHSSRSWRSVLAGVAVLCVLIGFVYLWNGWRERAACADLRDHAFHLARTHNQTPALARADEFLARFPERSGAETRTLVYAVAAEAAVVRNNFLPALSLTEQLLRENPADERVRAIRRAALQRLARRSTSSSALERALGTIDALGRAGAIEGDAAEAKAARRLAVLAHAWAVGDSLETEIALAHLERELTGNQNDLGLLAAVAFVAVNAKLYQRALAACDAALGLRPDDRGARRARAECRLATGDWDGAWADAERLTATAPPDDVSTWIFAADVAAATGRTADAVRCTRARFAARGGASAEVDCDTAVLWIYLDAEWYHDALGVVARLPLRVVVWEDPGQIGLMRFRTGDYAGALAVLPETGTQHKRWCIRAWVLATCPETKFRNGPEAVRLARLVLDALPNRSPDPKYVDRTAAAALLALAAGLAETGAFAEAKDALANAKERLNAAGGASRWDLDLFGHRRLAGVTDAIEASRPYRDVPVAPMPRWR